MNYRVDLQYGIRRRVEELMGLEDVTGDQRLHHGEQGGLGQPKNQVKYSFINGEGEELVEGTAA